MVPGADSTYMFCVQFHCSCEEPENRQEVSKMLPGSSLTINENCFGLAWTRTSSTISSGISAGDVAARACSVEQWFENKRAIHVVELFC